MNRVLKDLIRIEVVDFKKDNKDTRLKHVYLNDKGKRLFNEVFNVQKKLASEEGIFSEPAGATALTGLYEAVKRKEVDADDRIVCLVTGSAFKDAVSLGKMASSGKHKRMEHDQISTELNNLC